MDIETSKNDNNLDESYEEDNFEMNSEIIEGLHIPRPEAGIHVQARQCIGRADGLFHNSSPFKVPQLVYCNCC